MADFDLARSARRVITVAPRNIKLACLRVAFQSAADKTAVDARAGIITNHQTTIFRFRAFTGKLLSFDAARRRSSKIFPLEIAFTVTNLVNGLATLGVVAIASIIAVAAVVSHWYRQGLTCIIADARTFTDCSNCVLACIPVDARTVTDCSLGSTACPPADARTFTDCAS